MEPRGTSYITIQRAADILGKTPADTLALAEAGVLDAHRVGDVLFVSRVSVDNRSNR